MNSGSLAGPLTLTGPLSSTRVRTVALRKRLLRLLTAKGSTLRTPSVAMGRNDRYLQQFIYRGTPQVLAEDDREILAEHLGCRPELLKHGRSFRLSTHAKRPPPFSAYAAPVGYSVLQEAADVRAGPDSDAWNGELRETGEGWLFADSFIRHRLRADPGDLWMVEVDGDSMEPLLSSGDHMLIDVSRTVPAPPGIFVIWDGIALAKRIEHVPHSDPPKVVLKPVNPGYDSHERPPGRSVSSDGRSGSRNGCSGLVGVRQTNRREREVAILRHRPLTRRGSQQGSAADGAQTGNGKSETAKERDTRRRARASPRVRADGRPAQAPPAGRCVAAGARPRAGDTAMTRQSWDFVMDLKFSDPEGTKGIASWIASDLGADD